MNLAQRILLVEDDALSLKLMRDVLQSSGYDVTEATAGASAIELTRLERPDLIVMDIGLPGMNGLEATSRLKSSQETWAIPIIAVTAYAMPGDEERMRSAGCDAYLTKPLKFSDFVSVVEQLLGSAAGSGQDAGAIGSAK